MMEIGMQHVTDFLNSLCEHTFRPKFQTWLCEAQLAYVSKHSPFPRAKRVLLFFEKQSHVRTMVKSRKLHDP